MNTGNRIKWAAGRASLLLQRVMPRAATDSIGILLYHRISPTFAGVGEPTWNVTPEQFRRQLTELQNVGFNFLSLRNALNHYGTGEPAPSKSVVVTFDDGYDNVYENAWPVLRELNIPATIFVNSAFVDSDDPFHFAPWALENTAKIPAESFRPLSLAHCRELHESGLIELAAHTHSHQDFRRRPDDFRADLQTNVDWLRQEFGIADATFAFPYGRVSLGFAGGELTEVARAVGVTCALTTECVVNKCSDDPFEWGRFNVYDWDTGATLEAKLNGWYGWMPKLQDCVRQTLGRNH